MSLETYLVQLSYFKQNIKIKNIIFKKSLQIRQIVC